MSDRVIPSKEESFVSAVLHSHIIEPFIGEPAESTEDYIQQFVIKEFTWDAFPVEDIRPLTDLPEMGDNKPAN